MKNIYIYGTGGAGREIVPIIDDMNEIKPRWNIIGFLDDNKGIHAKSFGEHRVKGGREILDNTEEQTYVVMGIADPKTKRKLIESVTNPNVQWVSIVHPLVYADRDAVIGNGSVICFNNIISIDTKLGEFVYVNFSCIIPHDTVIGKYSSLMNNVILSGNVSVGENVFIGSNATVIQGINIGDNAVIGAGAVVIRDVPANTTVVGNPAR